MESDLSGVIRRALSGVEQRVSKAFGADISGVRWTSIDPDMTHLGPTGKRFADDDGYDGRATNSAVIGAAAAPEGGMAAFNLRRIEGDLDVMPVREVDLVEPDAGEHTLTEW